MEILGYNTQSKNKLAILYIATKKYIQFWDLFYTSSKKFLMPQIYKHYFIFTDCPENFKKEDDITIITIDSGTRHQINCNRFYYFLSIESSLESFDYCVFFNANTSFIDEISNILPGKENDYLLCHKQVIPNVHCSKLKTSVVCVRNLPFYCRGSLIGGRTNEFLNVCKECQNMMNKDKFKLGLMNVITDEDYYTNCMINKHPLNIEYNKLILNRF